jgi:hypothetical protein
MINYTDPRDAATLERKREQLARELDRMAHTRSAYRAGRATPDMMQRAADRKHLLTVLEGPRPLYERGALDVLAAVVVVFVVTIGGAISDAHAARGDCWDIARRYVEAEPGTLAHARASRAMSRESCYVEDYLNDGHDITERATRAGGSHGAG